ncbi:MAG: hypothetical protein ABSF08_09465 [Candidatus Cybelea sp.]
MPTICVAVAMLASCGGSQPPIGAPRAMPQTSAIAAYAERGKSWMLPEAKGEDLLYVTITGCPNTCVYSYPDGKLVGAINAGNGGGLCADAGGDVFVPSDGDSDKSVVYEFAHGQKQPIAALDVPGYFAASCSVDPTTGNLAVPFLCKTSSCGNANAVAIYQGAKGQPTVYEDSNVEVFLYCGYDDAGNLFADGSGGKSGFAFAELQEGATSFINLSVDQSIGSPGQVQWDGSYITIQDEAKPGSIYQMEVSGSTTTIVGVTKLKGVTGYSGQSWIQGQAIIVGSKPRGKRSNIGLWQYPTGGRAYQRINGFPKETRVYGLTVSVALPRRNVAAHRGVHGAKSKAR